LPHYLAKFECSTLQLYTTVAQFKSVTNSLFTANIYRNVMFWIACLCQLIYNITACVQNIRHQQASMLCVVLLVHATLSMDASMMTSNCCNAVPSVQQALSQFMKIFIHRE